VTTRRAFLGALTGGLLTAPLTAGAQQAGKVPHIGWLGGPTRESAQPFVQPFLQGLKDLGWVEGQNIVIEWRFAGGRAERLPALAAELVRLRVELIVVPSTPTALAAKNATGTIPLVTVGGGDPVALGLVASLARPGGNITGLTSVLGPEIAGKQLALLKEILPKVAWMAALWNPATPGNALYLKEAELAARALGVELQPLEARSLDDFNGVFAAMTARRAGALLILGDVMFTTHRRRLADLAAKNRLPAIFGSRQFADDGGLMAYGAVITDNFRRAATYVDKILRGAKPADLPVERPTKFELVINLKTAKTLGLTIPPSLLQRADEVIQ
jgi:putative tryptophan/tyrosine transport system substrate-binding protein